MLNYNKKNTKFTLLYICKYEDEEVTFVASIDW